MDLLTNVLNGLNAARQGFECSESLFVAAIDLLERQKPHVLTKEQMLEYGKPVFIEYRYLEQHVWALLVGYDGNNCHFNAVTLRALAHKIDVYGKYWRCWTDVPTERQMAEVKWE